MAYPAKTPASEPRMVDIAWVRHALGLDRYGQRRLFAYLTGLIAMDGFPRPLPGLVRGQMTRDVCGSSRWLRDAVDAWLGGYLPPEAAAAMDSHRQASAVADMDGAGILRLIRGGRA